MTNPSYDLTHRPWLLARPIGATADVHRLGLREVLARAHELSDVEVPLPPATAGLWRVLALLTARVTGLDEPEDRQEWLDRRNEILRRGRLSEADIDAYFDRHCPGGFDLFSPDRPWMQDPRLRTECPKPAGVNKLVWGRPAGNNSVWLGHHVDSAPAPVTSAEAAWSLLAWLYYGPSGRCASRTVRTTTEANTTAGPLRRSISFHPAGPTLFHSLVLNVPYPDDGDDVPAPWEADTLPDPLGIPPSGHGLATTLVCRYRHAVLLRPSPNGEEVTDAWITWAWRRPHPEVLDPYLIFDTSNTGSVYARYADADRAIWRDIDALLLKSSADGATRRPEIFDGCSHTSGLPAEIRDEMRVRAFGFEQDGQTRDKQWFSAETPPVLRWLTDENEGAAPEDTVRITEAHDAAERSGRALRAVLAAAWHASTGVREGQGPWLRRGMAHYWPRAEREFWTIVFDERHSGRDNTFIHTAVDAFDAVTEPYARRPRVAEALERTRRGLYAGWVNPGPPPEE